jgi:hypothetical protein
MALSKQTKRQSVFKPSLEFEQIHISLANNSLVSILMSTHVILTNMVL